jgi:hypothetical protein
MSFRNKFKKKYFAFSFKNISLFLFIWLLSGFSLGTVTLLYPVRWIVNIGKDLQFSQTTESLAIKFIILLFIIFSFYISLLITRTMLKRKSFLISVSVIIILLITTTGFTWLWMNPSMMQIGNREITEERVGNVEFVFGPYPTENEIMALKNDGYTAIISLLHPAVVPFEPKLISDEREVTKSLDIQLIEAPMLPWVSDNKESIEKIKNIAINGNGKYYVHCYLGKDRVNVVKRIIQQYSAALIKSDKNSLRKITDLESFERGEIIELDKDVYLTPYPTDDEFFGYVLNGYFKKVVSLLNPNHPPDTMWINKEVEICKSNLMPYELLPVEMNPFDANKILEIAEKTKKMARPLLIHAFLTKSPQTDAFITAYNTGLPPLSANLFERAMKRGKTELIAPNILIGPNPTRYEFSTFLYFNGIRNILYIGDDKLPSAKYDWNVATKANLKWFALKELNSDAMNMLKSGGPWYVYGISNDKMISLLNVSSKKEKLLSVVE